MSENSSATWLQNEFGIESRFDRLSDRGRSSRFDRLSDHEPVEATKNQNKKLKK